MTITASTGQQAATTIQYGTTNLALVSGSQPANVTQAAPVGPGINITNQKPAFTLAATGTLDAGATLELQAQINGSSFMPVYVNGTKVSFTGAQITGSGNSTGVYVCPEVKANQIRFVLIGQSTAGGGVITRVMD